MIKAVIFDFDYTLGDSTQGIVLCANEALRQLGQPEQSAEAIRKTIGLSLPATYAALTGRQQPEEAARFSAAFKKKGDEVMVANTVFYNGVPEMLAQLQGQGIKTAIVTTKLHYRIEQILGKFEATELIDLIVGAEDVKAPKPDPQGLLLAIRQLGLLENEVLYVGDSTVDAQTAQKAGVAFAAVLTGTTTRQDFEKYPFVSVNESVITLKIPQ